jgi:cathepsin X
MVTARVRRPAQLTPADKMKAELFARGPISCELDVTARFEAYDGGVFSQQRLINLPNHVLAVVGWGVDEDGPRHAAPRLLLI